VLNGVTAAVRRARLLVGVAVAILLLGLGIAYAAGPLGTADEPAANPSATAPGATRDDAATSVVRSGLPTVAPGGLPAEARRTLTLIDRGGPFPYARDGSVFGNRERLLPPQRSGYYHEYTVPTPGESDRGARRIVAGQSGEAFYTADHYRSFREVVR